MEWAIHKFGTADDEGRRLECAISSDKLRVVLSERRSGHQVGMYREEAVELLKLLGKEFVLDVLGDI